MVDTAMREVTTDFADADGLVIDIRFNQGGSDSMGYALVSWLTENPVLVARKRAVYDGAWTELQDVYVEPRDTSYFDRPIVLLQSGSSISAAETFAIAMNELPQVISVGTPTYGVLSDVLQRVLPNGWIAALSNEVYEAPDSSVYEAVGVPVDVEVSYDDDLTYYENLDATLERALQELRLQVER
jgi:carboxyl-terminal processing protease